MIRGVTSGRLGARGGLIGGFRRDAAVEKSLQGCNDREDTRDLMLALVVGLDRASESKQMLFDNELAARSRFEQAPNTPFVESANPMAIPASEPGDVECDRLEPLLPAAKHGVCTASPTVYSPFCDLQGPSRIISSASEILPSNEGGSTGGGSEGHISEKKRAE
ncbi:hypothetical protein BO71DRAFT_479799 [Aspergillus ellipticus CBS 707.79]|uniref:Uncharacterized protein n=1 Tax=Aspergillus ellipticus CBS 707.79 TaxID=1448320 RepID=A0A319DRM6_9EURO|nr:hypothetical protein BO71DRAFT_479799 [Aspergillus ellipticus CBS 707.79]